MDAFAVAPMMDVTDHHFRAMARILSGRALLYTEMVVDATLKYNPHRAGRWLAFDAAQSPLVLQLGGSDPDTMAAAAAIAAQYPYSAININCGCPSDKVAGSGCFGAALMRDASRVAALCNAIRGHSPPQVPVTVKCRLGVNDSDSYDFVHQFVDTVSRQSEVRHFIIHARKAVLGGLSPAQNRVVPPLMYERVLALRDDFPHLQFSLNGGLQELNDVLHYLDAERLHGVMLGRAVMYRPWDVLAGVDEVVYGDRSRAQLTRRQALEQYGAYMDRLLQPSSVTIRDDAVAAALNANVRPSPHLLIRPLHGLFWGVPRVKAWHRCLDAAVQQCKSSASSPSAPTGEFEWRCELVRIAEQVFEPVHLDTTWRQQQAQRREVEAQRQSLKVQPPVTGASVPPAAAALQA